MGFNFQNAWDTILQKNGPSSIIDLFLPASGSYGLAPQDTVKLANVLRRIDSIQDNGEFIPRFLFCCFFVGTKQGVAL